MYEKRIKQLVTDYQGRGVAVVVIMGNDAKAEKLSEYGYTDVGDSFADMKARAAYRSLNYPYLYDGATQAVALKYGPTATPHAFIFDQQRILRYEGRIDSNQREELATKHEARDAVDALLAGKPVAVTDTPAVGCSTKWAYKAANVENEIAQFQREAGNPGFDLRRSAQEIAPECRHGQAFARERVGYLVRAMCRRIPGIANDGPYVCKPAVEYRDVKHQQS